MQNVSTRCTKECFRNGFGKNFRWKYLMPICFSLFIFVNVYAQSTQLDDGYRDHDFDNSLGDAPTGEKPQSKLWYIGNTWYGSLWDDSDNSYTIHQFDFTTQSWTNTGVAIDDRPESRADVLWDGQKLYVASQFFSEKAGSASSEKRARLYRYSYNSGNNSYSLDSGFPVDINETKSETLVLDKDSTGKLWITWTESKKVWINCSTTNDQTWGTPFSLPVQGSSLSNDDISSITAFGENKIGLLWSNQNDQITYFAVHRDGDPAQTWQSREEALEDDNLGAVADDHLNLKMACDNQGNVYAVTKTSLSSGNAPLIYLLKRNSNGNWSRYLFSDKDDRHTRPIILIDTENDELYVFASRTGSSRGVYYKKTSLNNISFSSGLGTKFIYDNSNKYISNPTSTKQCLHGLSDLVVLAGELNNHFYCHNTMDLNGSSGNNPPVAANDATTTSEDTPVAIDILANDSDVDGTLDAATVAIGTLPASGSLSTPDPATGIVTYTPDPGFNGSDFFTYTVNDDGGEVSNTATVEVEVTATAPNNPPVAADDTGNTNEDTAVVIDVIDNDTDADGTIDVGTVQVQNAPLNGSTTVNTATGEVTYTPVADFNGSDSFTYTVNNNSGVGSNSATVLVTVNPINDAPSAHDDTAGTPKDTPVAIDILANDSDVDGTLDAATVTVGTLPVNGSLSTPDPATGIVTYTPDPGFDGSDSFTYTVNDDKGKTSNTATVEVTIFPPAPPVQTFLAVHDSYTKVSSSSKNYGSQNQIRARDKESTNLKGYVKFNVTNPGGTVQNAVLRLYVIRASQDGGSVFSVSNDYLNTSIPWTEDDITSGNAPAITGPSLDSGDSPDEDVWLEFDVTTAVTGAATYSFALKSNSAKQIYYSSKEGGHSPELVITTGSGGGNNPPVAQNDVATTPEDTPVAIDILDNDSDVDGTLETATVTVVTLPASGSLSTPDPATGIVTYTPDPGFNGTDTFTYTVNDNNDATSNIATVKVTVSDQTPPNKTSITTTFQTIHDAYVKLSSPDNNYGSKNQIRTRDKSSKTLYSYLKFHVNGLNGTVQSATLRLYVIDPTVEGSTVYEASNDYISTSTPWTEDGINGNNAPAITGSSLDSAGDPNEDVWVEFDVTLVVTGNTTYSFALKGNSVNSVKYSSKEGDFPPELVVVTNSNASAVSKQSGALSKNAGRQVIANNPQIPATVTLNQNYPNPFMNGTNVLSSNSATVIKYGLPEDAEIRLIIYNQIGRRVRELVHNRQSAGEQQVIWNGLNDQGHSVGSGIYFYRLHVGAVTLTKRLTVLK